jgi:hypothetical protein
VIGTASRPRSKERSDDKRSIGEGFVVLLTVLVWVVTGTMKDEAKKLGKKLDEIITLLKDVQRNTRP